MGGPFAPPAPSAWPAIRWPAGSFVRLTGSSPSASAGSSGAGVADRIALSPCRHAVSYTPASLAVRVTTGVALAQGRILLYVSDADGLPSALAFVSPALDFSAVATITTPFTSVISAGVQYWAGVWHSSTASIVTMSATTAPHIESATSDSTQTTSLVQSVAFAGAAPDPWVYNVSQTQLNTLTFQVWMVV